MNKFMEQGFDLSEIVEDDDSSSFELILSNLTAESAKLIVFYKWKYGYLGVDYNCRVAPALPIENIEPTDPIEPIDINPTQRDRQAPSLAPVGFQLQLVAMKYDLFLFDADDTLFDFGASERMSFEQTLNKYDIAFSAEIYSTYKTESKKLWRKLELGQTTKDFLKVERFRTTFKEFGIDANPEKISESYLEILPENVCLNPYAIEICNSLSKKAQIGIVTNGIESVQKRRLEISGLKETISFMVVSEECGYAKPDKRFFEHTMIKAQRSSKDGILVIGDRIETDITGAHEFGLDSCWYNPNHLDPGNQQMTFQISCLSELESFANQSLD